MSRQLGAVREVELALDQPAGALVAVVLGADRAAIDRDQPAADHRIPVVARDALLAQLALEGIGLRRLDADDEAVGRIGRRGGAPARDQVGAQQHQQHQRQQAHRQRADLHHRIARARGPLPNRQRQPGRRAGPPRQAAQQPHGQPGQRREQQQRQRKAADRDQAQLEVAAGQQQQAGKAQRAQAQH
ncbi:hypothetical protein F5985_18615, partial [Malikia spinosa]|nr:hypothetical protein [Malikia spinosa]